MEISERDGGESWVLPVAQVRKSRAEKPVSLPAKTSERQFVLCLI
jgi:hypothetical protein